MRQFLEHATGLSIYPIISFLFFSSFFIGFLIWLFTRSKDYITQLEQLPLDEVASETHEIN